jgi:phosphohistidine phosphatase
MNGRVLLLVRHAKAVQDAATDELRPLAARGHRDAETAGRWLAELGITLDLVVVSPAVRAQETWAEIAAAVDADHVLTDERIYDNTVDDLLAVLADVSEEDASVALVGHNPSMHGLAVTLDDGNGDVAGEAALREGYPTCGVAIFDVPGSWADLASGSATLRTFAAPRA